jgi:hypothetical protein
MQRLGSGNRDEGRREGSSALIIVHRLGRLRSATPPVPFRGRLGGSPLDLCYRTVPDNSKHATAATIFACARAAWNVQPADGGPEKRFSHHRRLVWPAIGQDVGRALLSPSVGGERLLQPHEPLSKCLQLAEPLQVLPAVRMMEHGHIFGGLVVVARFKAERYLVALVEPDHKVGRSAGWTAGLQRGVARPRLLEGRRGAQHRMQMSDSRT